MRGAGKGLLHLIQKVTHFDPGSKFAPSRVKICSLPSFFYFLNFVHSPVHGQPFPPS